MSSVDQSAPAWSQRNCITKLVWRAYSSTSAFFGRWRCAKSEITPELSHTKASSHLHARNADTSLDNRSIQSTTSEDGSSPLTCTKFVRRLKSLFCCIPLHSDNNSIQFSEEKNTLISKCRNYEYSSLGMHNAAKQEWINMLNRTSSFDTSEAENTTDLLAKDEVDLFVHFQVLDAENPDHVIFSASLFAKYLIKMQGHFDSDAAQAISQRENPMEATEETRNPEKDFLIKLKRKLRTYALPSTHPLANQADLLSSPGDMLLKVEAFLKQADASKILKKNGVPVKSLHKLKL